MCKQCANPSAKNQHKLRAAVQPLWDNGRGGGMGEGLGGGVEGRGAWMGGEGWMGVEGKRGCEDFAKLN